MPDIPTAEELAVQIEDIASYEQLVNPIIFASLVAVKFAQLHVTQALKEASEKALITADPIDSGKTLMKKEFDAWADEDYYYYINKDLILNAYPLNLIR